MPLSSSFDFLTKLDDSVFGASKKILFLKFRDASTVAALNFPSWASILEQLQSLSPLPPKQQPESFNDKIYDLLTTYSTASYTTLTALILSVIFLVYRYLMSSRNSFGYYGGGRASPFLSNLAEAAPRNLSGHFEYIDPDHDIYKQSHRPSVAVSDYDDPNAPDRLHVRYMASLLNIEFPPYTISEERVLVEDLRLKVADKLQVDPRRVRLVYKSRDLKHNSWPLRRYHIKQNSEVAAIVTESSSDYNDPDGHSESGSDSGSGRNTLSDPRRQRPRAHSTVRYRSDEKVPVSRGSAGTHLHPNGHVSSRPAERPHRESLKPSDRPERSDRREREPSTSRGASPSPSLSTASIPPADPHTPLGKLQALSSTFHTTWLPDCTRFILNPPPDLQARQKELLKLSEGVMSQIVLKADNIDHEGNTDARMVRKALINDANRVLKELDALRT